jgi:hypothetical protein
MAITPCGWIAITSSLFCQVLDHQHLQFPSPSQRRAASRYRNTWSVYSLPIHCLFIASSRPIHCCLFTAYCPFPAPLLIHCLVYYCLHPLTVNSMPIHSCPSFTVLCVSQSIHCLFTAYHCLFTAYSLPTHYLFTVLTITARSWSAPIIAQSLPIHNIAHHSQPCVFHSLCTVHCLRGRVRKKSVPFW